MNAAAPPVFRPWAVLLVYLGSVALLLWGLLRSPYAYSDPRFVVHYLGTEVQVALLCTAVTLLALPAARVGLRLPRLHQPRLLLPFATLLAVALAVWAVRRLQMNAPLPPDAVPAWHVLRTTLLVGVTEEWVYRGVLFAALSHWLGLRRGAVLSLLLFGALHLMNMAAGQPFVAVAVQFVLATLSGASLLLVALALRSLPVGMLLHGLYDFLVFDAGRLPATDTTAALTLLVPVVAFLTGLYSALQVLRLQGGEPFPAGSTGPSS